MSAAVELPIRIVIDGIPATLPQTEIELEDGRIGYYQRTQFDCLRAAVATTTQVPYDECGEIPSLGALYEWADARGYRVDWFPAEFPPFDRPLWIGFSPPYEPHNARHTIVGAFEGLYFDPGSGWVFPGGAQGLPTTELEYAITIERHTPC